MSDAAEKKLEILAHKVDDLSTRFKKLETRMVTLIYGSGVFIGFVMQNISGISF